MAGVGIILEQPLVNGGGFGVLVLIEKIVGLPDEVGTQELGGLHVGHEERFGADVFEKLRRHDCLLSPDPKHTLAPERAGVRRVADRVISDARQSVERRPTVP